MQIYIKKTATKHLIIRINGKNSTNISGQIPGITIQDNLPKSKS